MADPIAVQAPHARSIERTSPPPRRDPPHTAEAAIDRIENALTRIDTATRRRAEQNAKMEQRHATLRQRMTEAVATLDTILAAADASPDEDA